MKTFLVMAVGLLANGLPALAQTAEPKPPGIGIRVTMLGPLFIDEHGKTLYQSASAAVGYGDAVCPDRPLTIIPIENLGYNQVEEFPMRVRDPELRGACTERYPPLIAPVDAKPVGYWTIYQRENGVRQWAYRGKPLHTSRKDKTPGDVSSDDIISRNFVHSPGWQVATAPLAAPPGIEMRLTALGLALTTSEGRTLYYTVASGKPARNNRTEEWTPLFAPAAAEIGNLPRDWSIVDIMGGLQQWAWKGNPLYTFGPDSGDLKPRDIYRAQFVDAFGDMYAEAPGWRVALLKPASGPPAGLSVISTRHAHYMPSQRIYADANGKTVYAISCSESTPDHLDCDDVGDSPRYWLSFCGGEERCRRDWNPLLAPADAKPVDGLWSISRMNPRHPYKPLNQGEKGLFVWTYQGRFVFTYAEDKKPGDILGAIYHLQGMNAVTIPAFNTPLRESM